VVYLLTVVGVLAWIASGAVGLLLVLRKGYWLEWRDTRALLFARLAVLAGPFMLVPSIFLKKKA
jgi:hypothetical protein